MSDLDITTPELYDEWIGSPDHQPATVIGLDLTSRAVSSDPQITGSVFAGCQLTSAQANELGTVGCILVPQIGSLPIPGFRGDLYRVRDLYRDFDPHRDGSWSNTPDHAAWVWFIDPVTNQPRPMATADLLAARTHDATIETALNRLLREEKRPVVGIMGGHDTARSDPLYSAIASLARAITRSGRLIVTGGGPGLMEAGNLGAFLAPYPDNRLAWAVAILSQADDYKSHGWLATACQVRSGVLGDWRGDEEPGSANVGIPTWLYGSEPPNMFATHSAKLFFNSVREDGLVTVADGGILFAVGNAGTVQEIFQDATQNYYRATKESTPNPTPMVLFGAEYWSRSGDDKPVPDPSTGKVLDKRKPLMPLLEQLAAEKEFTDAVVATSDPEEALQRLAPAAAEPGSGRSLAWRRVPRT